MFTLKPHADKYASTIAVAQETRIVDGVKTTLRAQTKYDINDDRHPVVLHQIFVDRAEEGVQREIDTTLLSEHYTSKDMVRDFNEFVYGDLPDDYIIISSASRSKAYFGRTADDKPVFKNFVVLQGISKSKVFGDNKLNWLCVLNGSDIIPIEVSEPHRFDFAASTVDDFLDDEANDFETVWKEARHEI